MPEFEWDHHNIGHIALHGVSVAEAEYVLRNPTLDLGYQDWHDEERFAEVGETANTRILLVITTWRGDTIRVVTAYEASQRDVRAYRIWRMTK